MKAFRKPDQIIHPYYFGDPQKKLTCLWLKNLPKLVWIQEPDLFDEQTATGEPKPMYVTKNGKAIHWTEGMKGVENRGKERSRFWPSIARAMAKQWGSLPMMGKKEFTQNSGRS